MVSWQAGEGARGPRVILLQRALASLHFATPVTGYFDSATGRAVTAFRKTNGMGTTGYASTSVYAKLFRGSGAFKLRYPTAGHKGKHVEFDWSRQVLVLAKGGHPYRIYHASSGKASTPTVLGKFSFYLKTPGTNSHGMVDSNYFIGGYAIHGYADVPELPGEPRLPAGADPERTADLRLGPDRRPDLRLYVVLTLPLPGACARLGKHGFDPISSREKP